MTTDAEPDDDDSIDTSRAAVQALEDRRAAHGIPASNLAEMAQVDAGYLRSVLQHKRKARATFVGKVTRALDRFDEEVGGRSTEAHEMDLVEIEVASGTADFKVVVKGPVRDRDQIAETALRLMAEFRASERAGQTSSEKPDSEP